MTPTFVHATAVVDPGAQLGPGSKVWHFSHVCEGAVIGEDTSLGQNVFVASGVRVGARVRVQNNVSLYAGVEIGDDVFLGPSCVFTNVVNPRAFVSRKHEFQQTHVAQGATVGANATIVCGHDIGRYAFVGAGAVVTRGVPDYALVLGNPGKHVGFMCRCGERLQKPSFDCAACGTRYRIEGEYCEPA